MCKFQAHFRENYHEIWLDWIWQILFADDTCAGSPHIPSLGAMGLSVGYETWPLIGCIAGNMIGWSEYKLGNSTHAMRYELMWPMGISTFFQRPLKVPLHSPNSRQMPAHCQLGCARRLCKSLSYLCVMSAESPHGAMEIYRWKLVPSFIFSLLLASAALNTLSALPGSWCSKFWYMYLTTRM